jgi:hypothetical protein
MTINRLSLASALRTIYVFPRIYRTIVGNPVVVELRRSWRRVRLVRELWQLDRADAAAAKSVAYERAFLNLMERDFTDLLRTNRDKRHQLRLTLINLDAEAL